MRFLPLGRVGFPGDEKVQELNPSPADARSFWLFYQPASRDVACTEVYGMVENVVELGTDLEPGKSYAVKVNDVIRGYLTNGASS